MIGLLLHKPQQYQQDGPKKTGGGVAPEGKNLPPLNFRPAPSITRAVQRGLLLIYHMISQD